MSDAWKTVDSPTWKKILKHRFFTAFQKDLYIEEFLNDAAKLVAGQDDKLETIREILLLSHRRLCPPVS